MIGSCDSGPVGIFILHTTSHKLTYSSQLQLLLLFVQTMQSPASSSEQDSTNSTPVKVAASEIVNVSAKSRKRIILAEGSPIGGSKRERKIAGQEELQFDTLIPFKNHPDGLECFSYNVVNYTSEPAPRHFVEALEAVMSDKSTNQKDPLDIIGVFKEWDIYKLGPLFSPRRQCSPIKNLR